MSYKTRLQELEDSLIDLRVKWRSASPVMKKIIQEKAEKIKGEIKAIISMNDEPQTEFQCYFEDKDGRCPNRQNGYWCAEEHRLLWLKDNYKGRKLKRKLTIEEMQSELINMGQRQKERRPLTLFDSDGSSIEQSG